MIRKHELYFNKLILNKQHLQNNDIHQAFEDDLDPLYIRNNLLSHYSLWATLRIQDEEITAAYVDLLKRQKNLLSEYEEIAASIDKTYFGQDSESTLSIEFIELKISLAKTLKKDSQDLHDYIDNLGKNIWMMLESRYNRTLKTSYNKISLSEYLTYLNWLSRDGILKELTVLNFGAEYTIKAYKNIIAWTKV